MVLLFLHELLNGNSFPIGTASVSGETVEISVHNPEDWSTGSLSQALQFVTLPHLFVCFLWYERNS